MNEFGGRESRKLVLRKRGTLRWGELGRDQIGG